MVKFYTGKTYLQFMYVSMKGFGGLMQNTANQKIQAWTKT